jgi:hypothetical protein
VGSVKTTPQLPVDPREQPAAVDVTSVTLRFFGDDLDPEMLSTSLGSPPTNARKKGDAIGIPEAAVAAKTGSWLLSSERQSSSALEAQIHALFDRLTDDLAVWKDLSEKYRGDLFCGLWSKEFHRGLELSPFVLERITERGLRVAFDVYFVDGD